MATGSDHLGGVRIKRHHYRTLTGISRQLRGGPNNRLVASVYPIEDADSGYRPPPVRWGVRNTAPTLHIARVARLPTSAITRVKPTPRPPTAYRFAVPEHAQRTVQRVTVYQLRHGHPETDGRYYRDIYNVLLSDIGQQQAELVAQELADQPIEFIGVSKFARAQETAAPLVERLPRAKVEVMAQLHEAGTHLEYKGKLPVSPAANAFIGLAIHGLRYLGPTRPGWRPREHSHEAMMDRQWDGIQHAHDEAAAANPDSEHVSAVLVGHDFPIAMGRLGAEARLPGQQGRKFLHKIPMYTALVGAGRMIEHAALVAYEFEDGELQSITPYKLSEETTAKLNELRAASTEYEKTDPAFLAGKQAWMQHSRQIYAHELVDRSWRIEGLKKPLLKLAKKHPATAMALTALRNLIPATLRRTPDAAWETWPPADLPAAPDPADGAARRTQLHETFGVEAPQRFPHSARR